MNCIPDQQCIDCYVALINHDVAWATVTPETPCPNVLDILVEKDLCGDLRGNGRAQDAFCKVFDDCVVWEEIDDGEFVEQKIDCDKLDKCEWEGFHASFVGDGICHRQGCYNSAICDWDGGDCCVDTCDDEKNEFADCGSEHYYCMDPKSPNCDPKLNSQCPTANATKEEIKCGEKETRYELNQYDSFGDGWGKTEMTIRTKTGDTLTDTKYSGGLKSGKEGTEILCLTEGCYNVAVKGGNWGEEATWEIRSGQNKGGPPLASGGTPTDCDFAIGTNDCENTCTGILANNDDFQFDDDTFDDFSSLEECINEKCVIQKELCEKDSNCKPCLADNIAVFCFTNELYNVVSQCTLCHCIDGRKDDCMDPDDDDYDDDDDEDEAMGGNNMRAPQCTPEQTLGGSQAIFEYSKCSNIESTKAMIENWDENAFGGLDSFEECSHSYNKDYAHGGRNPMDCMRILTTVLGDSNEKPAVKDLADKLYHNGEEFCDCASKSNKECPLCQSFEHFKTLLHESIDACMALDEIDCAAWSQFSEPCRKKMIDKFNTINFEYHDQCEFITDGCGDVGPFPAFRRLDCGKEISKSAWDFYMSYHKGCLGEDPAEKKEDEPVAPPTNSANTDSHYVPSPAGTNKPPAKPYVPADGYVPSSGSEPVPYKPVPYTSKDAKKGGHAFFFIFMTFVCGCGVYLYYKRRYHSYEFPNRRYRNMMGDEQLYGGLFDSASTSFEPPTLPSMT
jgi:hypothetical protein